MCSGYIDTRRKGTTLLFLVVLVLMGGNCSRHVNRDVVRMPEPGIADIQGDWFGWAEGMGTVFLYRLTLNPTGGALAIDFADTAVAVYTITHVHLRNFELKITVTPSKANEHVSVSGHVCGNIIMCTVAGSRWRHEVTFYRECELERRLSKLKNSMLQNE